MSNLYDTDFYAWTQAQATALAAGHVTELDLANLAEEIGSLGKNDLRALRSNLRVMLLHLLKWRHQPERRQDSIDEHRTRIQDIVADSPSLALQVQELLPQAYRQARRLAAQQTQLPPGIFPDTCPWTVDEVLDPEFWPEIVGATRPDGGRVD